MTIRGLSVIVAVLLAIDWTYGQQFFVDIVRDSGVTQEGPFASGSSITSAEIGVVDSSVKLIRVYSAPGLPLASVGSILLDGSTTRSEGLGLLITRTEFNQFPASPIASAQSGVVNCGPIGAVAGLVESVRLFGVITGTITGDVECGQLYRLNARSIQGDVSVRGYDNQFGPGSGPAIERLVVLFGGMSGDVVSSNGSMRTFECSGGAFDGSVVVHQHLVGDLVIRSGVVSSTNIEVIGDVYGVIQIGGGSLDLDEPAPSIELIRIHGSLFSSTQPLTQDARISAFGYRINNLIIDGSAVPIPENQRSRLNIYAREFGGISIGGDAYIGVSTGRMFTTDPSDPNHDELETQAGEMEGYPAGMGTISVGGHLDGQLRIQPLSGETRISPITVGDDLSAVVELFGPVMSPEAADPDPLASIRCGGAFNGHVTFADLEDAGELAGTVVFNRSADPDADFDGDIVRELDPVGGITPGLDFSIGGQVGGSYARRDLDLGGGSVAFVPFRVHTSDSEVPLPLPSTTMLTTEFNNTPGDGIIDRTLRFRFYGPVRTDLPVSQSPVELVYVREIGGVPVETPVDPGDYVVDIRRGAAGSFNKEMIIRGNGVYRFGAGHYRLRANPGVTTPIICDGIPGTVAAIFPTYEFWLGPDCNYDGLPDSQAQCGCAGLCTFADYDGSGGVDGDDIAAFFPDWQAGNTGADVDQSGGIDGEDIVAFFCWWQQGGCP